MLKTILNILGYGWLSTAIDAILAAKSNPTPENIEAAAVAATNAALQEFKPEYLPEAQAIEATVPGILKAAVALKVEHSVANGEALAVSLMALIKIFVPNVPEADAESLLSDIQNILADVGVK